MNSPKIPVKSVHPAGGQSRPPVSYTHLEGRNAVQEALAAGRPIDKLYIAAGETDRALARLASMARAVSYTHLSTVRQCSK